jgi:hypothetical protein
MSINWAAIEGVSASIAAIGSVAVTIIAWLGLQQIKIGFEQLKVAKDDVRIRSKRDKEWIGNIPQETQKQCVSDRINRLTEPKSEVYLHHNLRSHNDRRPDRLFAWVGSASTGGYRSTNGSS